MEKRYHIRQMIFDDNKCEKSNDTTLYSFFGVPLIMVMEDGIESKL
jgi:hypothetical protein